MRTPCMERDTIQKLTLMGIGASVAVTSTIAIGVSTTIGILFVALFILTVISVHENQ